MKLSAITTAVVLAGFAGVAMAGNPVENTQPKTLSPINVSQAVSECMQPGQASSDACAAFHRLIAANFTPRELRMVLTWESTHPQYLFDEIYSLHDRYETVLQEYVTMRQAADASRVAAR